MGHSSWVNPLNGDKDQLDFQCVSCVKEWSNKLWLFDHRSTRCPNGPIDPGTNKPISIPVSPNLANAQLSKKLKR
jgi:hypothetical protein